MLISPPIGEPLALHAEQRRFGAISVVHAQRDAMVVTELELGHVAVQVLLPAVRACREFRVWAGMIGAKEPRHAETQRAPDP